MIYNYQTLQIYGMPGPVCKDFHQKGLLPLLNLQTAPIEMSTKRFFPLALGFLIVLLLRTLYGTTMFGGEDAFQVYLIGLKWYTTGLFPFWGPDVVYTKSQIPGALQGLLAGGPLFIKAIPEAPFVLLNLLSLSALCVLGWHLSQRIPAIPKWFLWIWIISAPWTLTYSTHIENPSYLLPASILFFICIWEIYPIYERNLVDTKWAFLGLGFSLFWAMQLHLSWVLMMPFIVFAFWIKLRNGQYSWKMGLFFLAGSAITSSALLPTLLTYGIKTSGGTEQNIGLNLSNLLEAPNIMAKILSYACGEVVRFIGANNSERLDFLRDHPWAAPFTIFFGLAGIAQFGLFAWSFFQHKECPEWSKVRVFMLSSMGLVCVSYLFTNQPPRAHAFYLMFPVAIWYSFYSYGKLFEKRPFRVLASVFLLSGIIFHLAVAHKNAQRYGLSLKRDLIMSALATSDYTQLGIRRESTLEMSKWEHIWESPEQGKYQTGFEYQTPRYKPQNITPISKRNGLYACKMDTIQPFGGEFRSNLDLKQYSSCQYSAYIKGDFKGDIRLVFEIRSNGKNVFWKGIPVEKAWFEPYEWQKVQLQFSIPDQFKSGEEVMIYFWLSSKAGGTLFTDDIEVIFL